LIESKGSTEFGIASVTMSICKSILFDQRNVRAVSIYDEESKVCLSKPVVLGRKGVEQILELPLNNEEQEALAKSAKSLREVIEEAEKAEKK
jgi:L-lactate dehydrogenase